MELDELKKIKILSKKEILEIGFNYDDLCFPEPSYVVAYTNEQLLGVNRLQGYVMNHIQTKTKTQVNFWQLIGII